MLLYEPVWWQHKNVKNLVWHLPISNNNLNGCDDCLFHYWIIINWGYYTQFGLQTVVWPETLQCGSPSRHYFCTVAESSPWCDRALPDIIIPANREWRRKFGGSEHNKFIILGVSFEPLSCPHSPGFTGALSLNYWWWPNSEGVPIWAIQVLVLVLASSFKVVCSLMMDVISPQYKKIFDPPISATYGELWSGDAHLALPFMVIPPTI